LAGSGQSCTSYCNQENQACTPGHWPIDAFQLLRVAIAVDGQKCTNVRLSKHVYAPAVSDSASGPTDCYYNLDVGSTAPTCAEAPPAGTRRLCPCSQSGLQWFLASEGQSCRNACRARGGICGDETTVWPTTPESMSTVGSYIGVTCHTTKAGTASFNPSIGNDGTCHWGSSASGQAPFCDAVDWTNSQQKRICPCWDAA